MWPKYARRRKYDSKLVCELEAVEELVVVEINMNFCVTITSSKYVALRLSEYLKQIMCKGKYVMFEKNQLVSLQNETCP
jgi:hypothetical protein